jgi:SAM-dependent methyltransferase
MEDQVYRQLYEVENEHWWFTARKDILLQYLDRRLPLPPTARVLDVGCGTGAILESFSRRYQAFGSDMAPQAIAFCRERGLTRLHLGTLETYPPSEPFDLITMLDMVEHVEDDDGLLRTARRLLAPAGHVLIAVPAFPSLWSRHDEILHHKRRYTRRGLRRLVEHAGFAVEHLTFFNSFLFPVAWAKRLAARTTGSEKANDLDIPPRPLNALLRGVFRAERGLLLRATLPVGLSLLCLARKNGAA